MINFVQDGRTITVLAPYTIKSGAGAKVGNKFGVAAFDATSGAQLEMSMLGVFDLAKDTSTFADGDSVYWDDTAHKATSTTSSNTIIGAACLTTPSGTAALGGSSGDATVRVRLNAMSLGTVASANMDSALVQTASVSLSAAQLIAMGTTPVLILAAPSTGKALIVENILFEITTTSTVFTGGTAVSFVYHGGSVACHAGSIPATTITAVAGTTYTLLGPAVGSNGTVVPAATGIDIAPSSTAFAAGTGTAKVQVKYRIVTL